MLFSFFYITFAKHKSKMKSNEKNNSTIGFDLVLFACT